MEYLLIIISYEILRKYAIDFWYYLIKISQK